MSGIVGYTGNSKAADILLSELDEFNCTSNSLLAIAIASNDKIEYICSRNCLNDLKNKINNIDNFAYVGLGYSAKMTQGELFSIDTYSHLNVSDEFMIAYSGMIKNRTYLQDSLIQKGFTFISDTDTETILHLLEYYYSGDIVEATAKSMDKLEGVFTLGILCKDEKEGFVAVRRDNPLIIGLGSDGNYMASDISVITKYTKDVIFPENDMIVKVTSEEVKVFNTDLEEVCAKPFKLDWDTAISEKNGYDHFMLKEIMEQPDVLEENLISAINNSEISLNNIDLPEEFIKDMKKIILVGSGSSYNAAIAGKVYIEKLLNIPVTVYVSSEFLYSDPVIDNNTLVIALSQSGEKKDTISTLIKAKKMSAYTVAIVNSVGSQITRIADKILYIWAGIEMATATKSYSVQLLYMILLALYIGQNNEHISNKDINNYIKKLIHLPVIVNNTINDTGDIQFLASRCRGCKNIIFLGHGIEYAVGLEAVYKLNKVIDIYSDIFYTGEFNPISSHINSDTFVITICINEKLCMQTIETIKNIKKYGGKTAVITIEGNMSFEQIADYVIYISKSNEFTVPFEIVALLQLYVYNIAILEGVDVDNIENLSIIEE